ncbi:hypothetical protein BSPCLSOX_2221 [uncultured Gammaproteobacteria bacterium]|nr:hypothetical protein BSPCLSOX_2221 [uncultured Gammaproteobacteria bacterium]
MHLGDSRLQFRLGVVGILASYNPVFVVVSIFLVVICI